MIYCKFVPKISLTAVWDNLFCGEMNPYKSVRYQIYNKLLFYVEKDGLLYCCGIVIDSIIFEPVLYQAMVDHIGNKKVVIEPEYPLLLLSIAHKRHVPCGNPVWYAECV
jgi:hypothetical protein